MTADSLLIGNQPDTNKRNVFLAEVEKRLQIQKNPSLHGNERYQDIKNGVRTGGFKSKDKYYGRKLKECPTCEHLFVFCTPNIAPHKVLGQRWIHMGILYQVLAKTHTHVCGSGTQTWSGFWLTCQKYYDNIAEIDARCFYDLQGASTLQACYLSLSVYLFSPL